MLRREKSIAGKLLVFERKDTFSINLLLEGEKAGEVSCIPRGQDEVFIGVLRQFHPIYRYDIKFPLLFGFFSLLVISSYLQKTPSFLSVIRVFL